MASSTPKARIHPVSLLLTLTMLALAPGAMGQTTRAAVAPAEIMADAIKALARRDPYPLVTMLERSDLPGDLQEAAQQLLSDLGMRGTVAVLRRAEHHPALRVRLAIAMRQGEATPFEALRNSLWEAPGFEAALRADDLALGGMVPRDALHAATLAESIGWTGLAALIPYVTDPTIEIRAPIAAAMARLSHPAGFRILATLLASSDPMVVGVTLESMAVALPKGSREAAERFLDADDEARVSGAIAIVGSLGGSIDPVRGIPALALVRPPVTEALMDAMKRHDDAERLPVLLVDALTVGEVRDPLWVAREAIQKGQRGARGFAESLIHHPHWALRTVALDTVAKGAVVNLMDATSRLAVFEDAARSESPWVRWSAARGLQSTPDALARATLVILLGDSFAPVREEAAAALATQAPRDATPPLRRAATDDPDASVRNAARLALLKMRVVVDVAATVEDAEDEFLGPRTRTFLQEWLGASMSLDRTVLASAIRLRASRS